MKKSLIFFAALAALFSCAKENPVVETPAEETFSVELFASAPAEDADTKTTLVEGGKFVHWSKGDSINVLFFPNFKKDKVITGPSGVFKSHFDESSSAEAYFRTDSWSWAGIPSDIYNDQRKNWLADKGIAVYPATATAVSNKLTSSTGAPLSSEISFVLPEVQNAVVGNIESGLNFSYADVDRNSFISTVDNGAKTELNFKNACALIQLTMPAEMPKVTEISITSNDKVALTGHGSMKLSYYHDGLELDDEGKATVIVNDGKDVVLKNADGFKAGATYYAVVWPGAHNSGLTIEFMAEDGTVATKTTPGVTFTASKVKPYTFSKGLDFIAPVQDFNYIYADGTTGNDVKSNIVGVVIYRGNPKEKFNDPDLPDQYCNGLAISTKNVVTTWGGTSSFTVPSGVKTSPANFGKGGYSAKKIITDAGKNLPIYNNSSYSDLSKCNTSGWYIGTNKEWDYILSIKNDINALLEAAGCDLIQFATQSGSSAAIWLPLLSGNYVYLAYTNYYGDTMQYGTNSSIWYYSSTRVARPIFAF